MMDLSDPVALERFVARRKAFAELGTYLGLLNTLEERWYFGNCKDVGLIRRPVAAQVGLIFTRDAGAHSAGWWKNPDYERCYHLSLSYRDIFTHEPMRQQRKWSERLAMAFFGDEVRKIWIEPPYSPEGKQNDVYHYRLFVDAHWQAILPRGEVYSKENTPAGWKSWSEVHGSGVIHAMGEAG